MTEQVARSFTEYEVTYSHYNEENRGLPTEIRMKIWRYALDTELYIDPSSVQLYTDDLFICCPKKQGDASMPSIRRLMIQNLDDFPSLNLLLLNQSIRWEVMETAKASVTWYFPRQLDSQSARHMLSLFSSSQKHVTKEISLAADSLMPGLVWNSYETLDVPSFEAFRNIDSILHPIQPYSLSVRIKPLHPPSNCEPPSDTGRSLDSYSATELRHKFASNVLYKFWTKEVAKTMYHLVEGGHVAEFKFQQTVHCEGWRLALIDPVKVLFETGGFSQHLNQSELADLAFKLDWPVGSDLLSICITKKVEQH